MTKIDQILTNLCDQVYCSTDYMDVKWFMEAKGRIELLEVEQPISQPQRSIAVLQQLIPLIEQQDRSQVYQLLMQVTTSPDYPCTIRELVRFQDESIARIPGKVRLFKLIHQTDPFLEDRLRVSLLLWM